MRNSTLCRECFKRVVDDTAPIQFLLLTQEVMKCDCCKKMKHLVSHYYKYGEHLVSEDGLRTLDTLPRQKINPNYSFWSNEPLFID